MQSRKFSRLHLLGKYTYIRGIALIQWVCRKCLLLNFLGKKEVKWVLLLFSKHCHTKAVFRSKTRSENLPNPIARLSSSLYRKNFPWIIRKKFNEKTLNCFDHNWILYPSKRFYVHFNVLYYYFSPCFPHNKELLYLCLKNLSKHSS